MSKFAVLIIFTIALGSQAQAWPWNWYYACSYAATTASILDQVILSTEACTERPLHLSSTGDGSDIVGRGDANLWRGGYTSRVWVNTLYRIDHYDPCRGNFLFSEERWATEISKINFDIKNPNLDETVSYARKPRMTDQEATAAMAIEQQACEDFRKNNQTTK